MRRIVGNLLLLCGGLIAALLLAELIVRLSGKAPQVAYVAKWRVQLSENPRIGFEPIPNLDSTGKPVQFYGYHGRSNNMGFRDYDHQIEKPAGVERIIVLGDSVALGLWINDDEAVFPVQLEQILRNRGESVEVFNFAVSGYNTMQEVEMLKDKGLQFQPDVVVLAYCLNDREQNDGGMYYHLLKEAAGKKDIIPIRPPSSLRASALYRFLRYRLFVDKPKEGELLAGRRADFFARDTVRASLRQLQQLSDAHGFDVVVVIFPDFKAVDQRLEKYPYQEEHARIVRWTKQLELDHLDLLPAMRQCKERSPNELVGFDNYHGRPLAHRCAAEAVAAYLLEQR